MPRIAQRAEVALFLLQAHLWWPGSRSASCEGQHWKDVPSSCEAAEHNLFLLLLNRPPSSNTKHPKWFFILGGEFNIGDPNIKFKTLIIKTILVYNICLIQFLFKTYSKIAKTVPW